MAKLKLNAFLTNIFREKVNSCYLLILRTQLTPENESSLPLGRIKELNAKRPQLSNTYRCRSPPEDLFGFLYHF